MTEQDLTELAKIDALLSPAVTTAEQNRGENTFNLLAKIAELEEKLLTAHPTMPVLLREIHTAIKADPHLVTIMSEEHICTIVSGLKKVTNTQIVTAPEKKASKKVNPDDLALL